ncbi:unnamed protein product [Leuciscus chuanchicus]
MSAVKFDFLARRIGDRIQHSRTHSALISVAKRLAVTLRYLASGCSQVGVAASYRLGSFTVSTIIPEVCKAIWDTLQPEFVPFPSQTQWKEIQNDFWRIWNFPMCLGSNLTTVQQVNNYRHSRARRIIVNTFGIMASRWRIFGRPIDCSPDNVVHIVKACVALHNYLTHTDAVNPGNISSLSLSLRVTSDDDEWGFA